jgi:hypothetical protein
MSLSLGPTTHQSFWPVLNILYSVHNVIVTGQCGKHTSSEITIFAPIQFVVAHSSWRCSAKVRTLCSAMGLSLGPPTHQSFWPERQRRVLSMNMRCGRTRRLMGWTASWLAGWRFPAGDYSSFIQLKQIRSYVVICRLEIWPSVWFKLRRIATGKTHARVWSHSEIEEFVAWHQTVKSLSEIFRQRAAKLCQICDSTT